MSKGDRLVINADIVKPEPPEGVTLIEVPLVTKDFIDEFKIPEEGCILFHQTDITTLKFVEDNVADEVLAIHVIEHFEEYDLKDILRRWKDVLKPGGMVVVELPDILKCAINLLQVATTKEPKLWVTSGIRGFYGLRERGKPYMNHCWGYFPDYLAQIFRESGFIQTREEIAKFHGQHVRDFRMTALKGEN